MWFKMMGECAIQIKMEIYYLVCSIAIPMALFFYKINFSYSSCDWIMELKHYFKEYSIYSSVFIS